MGNKSIKIADTDQKIYVIPPANKLRKSITKLPKTKGIAKNVTKQLQFGITARYTKTNPE